MVEEFGNDVTQLIRIYCTNVFIRRRKDGVFLPAGAPFDRQDVI
jgi:hypothetical protein